MATTPMLLCNPVHEPPCPDLTRPGHSPIYAPMADRESIAPGSLRAALEYQPKRLCFGTSGRRGEVIHLTQLEVYINALAELEYLQGLPAAEGGIRKGDAFYFAYDLRPSSSQFVAAQGGRGEITQAIECAIAHAGMKPVNLGAIPTPALTSFALERGQGSMMITGSHIPFERNGYKTNSAKGELLKQDETPINARVEQVRARLYAQPYEQSLFAKDGAMKTGPRPLSPECTDATEAYIRRYAEFFAGQTLTGMRLLAYQHSAVGRDLLVEILSRLGADVIPAGRSDTFVPIDTEAIDAAQLATIQRLAEDAWNRHGPIHAVVSLDGDSDRPLILAVDPTGQAGSPCRVRFFGGDLMGMVVSEYLKADAVVVPITCNDAIDLGTLKHIVQAKTRIGSPFVIAGMDTARAQGRHAVCGWEANGGFLTGSDITRYGRTLKALPTRDAILPILGVLFSAVSNGLTLSQTFDRLPPRFSRSSLLRNFPRPVSHTLVQRFSPADSGVVDVLFSGDGIKLLDASAQPLPVSTPTTRQMLTIRRTLSEFFTAADGFGAIQRMNYIDGLRLYFDNGDVAHVRPSGNADELRIYSIANTQARADAIVVTGVAEPDGILRRLQRATA